VISVLVILGLAIGASIAIEAFAVLNLLGFGALSGIVGGLANVREMSPLVAGIAFAAQAGCRMTAEIGSMRIAEEIDATEAMGLRAIPFVVGTRLVGGMVIVIPGFVLTLLVSFFTSNAMIKVIYGQPGGTYDHYFVQFLSPTDLAYSTIKATMFCAAVTIIHCYYGFFASGGPVGVGLASGRAVRASLVAIMVLDFILTVALWGLKPTFVFKG
jgi:phospholipid/cholesterol/gamma-HCH transport system permease protein